MNIFFIFCISLISLNVSAEDFFDSGSAANLGQLLRHEAIYGNIPAIKDLLKRGADINAAGTYGETALYYSILYGRLQTSLFLIENHATPDPVDEANRTPLVRAAEDCNWRVVEALLKAGADVNHSDYFGKTPLIHSVESNCIHSTASLLVLAKNRIILDAEDNSFHSARDYISDPYIQSLFDAPMKFKGALLR